MALFMAVNSGYGQSEPIAVDDLRKFVLSSPLQMDFYSQSEAIDLIKNRNKVNDTGSIFPKGIEIDPEVKITDVYTGKVTQYPMPIKTLSSNHTMQIYVPDSTVHYTIRIKDFGERFEGVKK